MLHLFIECATQWHLHPVNGLPYRIDWHAVVLTADHLGIQLSDNEKTQFWDDVRFMERIALKHWAKQHNE